MKENKKQYNAPELTVVTFKVEAGFTESNNYGLNTSSVTEFFEVNNVTYNRQNQETWNSYSGGEGGSDNLFGSW